VSLDQIQHDHLRNLAARSAFEGHRQSEFQHAAQRVPIAILLAEYEVRHVRAASVACGGVTPIAATGP
jgi:hypothetical protein